MLCGTSTSFMRDIKTEKEYCMICDSPQSASPHFGAVSCLACAAFFRRTVSLDITFTCKQERNCRIYYELRMICRACRYEKCLQAGMKRECVQKKRPFRKMSRKESTKNDHLFIEPKREITASPVDEDTPNVMEQESIPFDCPASASSSLDSFDCSSPSTSTSIQNTLPNPQGQLPIPPVPTRPPTTSNQVDRTYEGRIRAKQLTNWTGLQILQHYCNEERLAMDARRVMYSEMPLEAMVQITGEIPFSRDRLTTHTLRGQRSTIQFEHFLSFQYSRRLPGFELLSKDEKAHLYKSCALGFSVLDMAWMSAKLRRKDDRLLIFTDGTYSDLKDYTVGWEDEPGLISREAKMQLFLEFNERTHSELVVPMFDLQLYDWEYAALKALTAWRVWYLQFTNTLQDLAKEQEKLILEGLTQQYQQTNQKDFAVRMGAIVLLIGTISDIYRSVTETFTKIQFFNLLDIDHVSKSLIKF